MLVLRGVLAVAMILCGLAILARMLMTVAAGFAVLPGIVLAAAMIALGAHRISLILRARRPV
ncbi:MAG TPA: hypothetical protein VKR05_01185 [Candidatus Cybelea sp.]|nr:hypothetical protein [Candidatus Cybelea sp.]